MWWIAQATIDGEDIALPWRHAGLELVRYGGVMLQLKSERDYVLSFTPQSNEFTLTVPSSANMGRTAGLCGNTFMQKIPDHLHFSAQCLSSNICCLPSSFTQVPAERIHSMSFLYVMAAQPQTSLGLSQTGLTIAQRAC